MTFTTLISAAQLRERLDDPSWRLVDCRHDLTQPQAGEQAYRAAHLPRAQFLHVDRDLSGTKSGFNGRHPLPTAEDFAALLARRGIGNDNQVVIYDDMGGMFAARLWWMLRWVGHREVAVLDGGLSAWLAGGGPLTDTIETQAPARFERQASLAREVPAAYVAAHLRRPGMLLLDARAPERFEGRNETLDPVAGRIPGALNRFFKDNLGADGRFKTPPQLCAEFTALLGGQSPQTLVNYCGSGVTSCHNLLALEVAGLHGARLYAGSWSEWCSDRQRPIATGHPNAEIS
jgi:thiosulfate/3-mercaptopyruvate sulfurtransferase